MKSSLVGITRRSCHQAEKKNMCIYYMNECMHNVLDLSIISLASLVNLRAHPLLNHLSFLLLLLLMFLFYLFLKRWYFLGHLRFLLLYMLNRPHYLILAIFTSGFCHFLLRLLQHPPICPSCSHSSLFSYYPL